MEIRQDSLCMRSGKLLYLQGDLNGLNPRIIVFLLVSITSKKTSIRGFKAILISLYYYKPSR